MAVDIGSEAASSSYSVTGKATIINLNNPAISDGIISSIEVWSTDDLPNFRVGVFFQTGESTYQCRSSSANLGTIASGAKRTFSGLALSCQSGDFIGCYCTGGSIRRSNSGNLYRRYSGEAIDPGDSASFGAAGTGYIMLGGYFGDVKLNTNPVTDIKLRSATGNATITMIGSGNPTERGFCYSEINNPPTTADSKVFESGSFDAGDFNLLITGLLPGRLYYLRAYAVNDTGVGYGNVVTFYTVVLIRTLRPTSDGDEHAPEGNPYINAWHTIGVAKIRTYEGLDYQYVCEEVLDGYSYAGDNDGVHKWLYSWYVDPFTSIFKGTIFKPGGIESIRKIRVVVHAKCPYPQHCKPCVKINGTKYYGITYRDLVNPMNLEDMTTEGNYFYVDWPTNPDNGLDWEVEDIANMSWGASVEITGSLGEPCISQMYLEIWGVEKRSSGGSNKKKLLTAGAI